MVMRLAPLDIQKKTFTRKKLGGVDEAEVKAFLDEVGREYETLHTEVRQQRETIAVLRQQVQEYQEMERTLKTTLVSAQKSSSDLRQNAEKECDLIVRNSELTAERIVDDARREVRDLGEEIRVLKKTRRKLRIELKNLLDGYYDLLEDEEPASAEARPTSAPRRAEGVG